MGDSRFTRDDSRDWRVAKLFSLPNFLRKNTWPKEYRRHFYGAVTHDNGVSPRRANGLILYRATQPSLREQHNELFIKNRGGDAPDTSNENTNPPHGWAHKQ